MELLFDSLISALHLLYALDEELFAIVSVSLGVSSLSTLLATLCGLPLGFLIAFTAFRGKRFIITCLNTLLALPTVVIGLVVYSFISRKGLFGPLELLYTQRAIVIGQVILIIPIITPLIIAGISSIDDRYRKAALTLGATRY